MILAKTEEALDADRPVHGPDGVPRVDARWDPCSDTDGRHRSAGRRSVCSGKAGKAFDSIVPRAWDDLDRCPMKGKVDRAVRHGWRARNGLAPLLDRSNTDEELRVSRGFGDQLLSENNVTSAWSMTKTSPFGPSTQISITAPVMNKAEEVSTAPPSRFLRKKVRAVASIVRIGDYG